MQPAPIDDEAREQRVEADASVIATPAPHRQRWIFACGTEFHLFVAYLLCSSAPPDCHRTLVLQVNHRVAAFVESAQQAAVWDRVVIAQDGHEKSDPDLLELTAGENARFFYFSWGFPALTKLFAEAVCQGWTICLADEGTLTYQPQTSLSKWLALNPIHADIARGYDYSAISEIWLMSPGLFLEQSHATIVPIDANAFIEKLRANPDAASDFRRFFRVDEGWSRRSFSEAIYLRQYFSAIGVLAEPLDAYLDREFRGALNPLDVCIKDHPGHRSSAYGDEGTTVDYKGPMEALVIARMATGEPIPTWFVSPISSAIANCAALGAGSKFVLLYKIVEQYCDWVGPDRDELLVRYAQIFPERQFFIPETWDDYSRLIASTSAADDSEAVDALSPARSTSRDLRAINAMLLEAAKAAQQREAAFQQQLTSRQAEEQQRLSDVQQTYEAREQQHRQELLDFQQRLETQQTQAHEREVQLSQQAEEQNRDLQSAAAMKAEQLQGQIMALEHELLERERAFTQQWTTWRAEEQQRVSETQQAHAAREEQQRLEIVNLQQQLHASQAAAAMHAEQLQGQVMAMQHELLERERAFTQQWTTWQTEEQQRVSETQRAHVARDTQQRQEIADLQQRAEAQRTQAQEREEQLRQQSAQQVQAMQLAAATQAEQLQGQVMALQHEILERERAFAQQWTTWRAEEQQRSSEIQLAYEAREAQLREDARVQIDTLRASLNQYTAYGQALAERMAALQSTWWWRLSLPWRHSSKWPDIANSVLPLALSKTPQPQATASAPTSGVPSNTPEKQG